MISVSLEQEIKKFLSDRRLDFRDKSSSYKDLDFTILQNDEPYFHLEAKEKRQRYNMNNWPRFADEADLFILDDLTVRKCLAYSPRCGIVIRDNPHGNYYFFSVIDLALVPKMRVNRHIRRRVSDIKGKWLINLRNGAKANTITETFDQIREYIRQSETILFRTIGCYGNYVDEEIVRGGVTRKPFHWDIDVSSTR